MLKKNNPNKFSKTIILCYMYFKSTENHNNLIVKKKLYKKSGLIFKKRLYVSHEKCRLELLKKNQSKQTNKLAVLHKRLLCWSNTNDIITDAQFGFKP